MNKLWWDIIWDDRVKSFFLTIKNGNDEYARGMGFEEIINLAKKNMTEEEVKEKMLSIAKSLKSPEEHIEKINKLFNKEGDISENK